MATLFLGVAGGAIGGAIGGSFLGVSAAAIGQAVGATIGRTIDQKLLAGSSPSIKQEGPRLDTLDIMTSQEGAPLAEISGRAAVAGEVIWATKMKEVRRTTTEKVGSGKNKQKVRTTNYEYFASFAVSLGEGPLSHYGRIWANGRVVDFSDLIKAGRLRFYNGSEGQNPDPLINSIEGGAPAYRGTAYIVFEDLPLEYWGNTVPQIKVEVWGKSGEMEQLVRGVNVIPGATEWGYMPTVVNRRDLDSRGNVTFSAPDNAIRYNRASDWELSMDQMDATLPNADTVSLIVSWFGTDLRAGLCEIEPRIERRNKQTNVPWRASSHTPETAPLISRVANNRPAFGSTPADIAVVRAIKNLRARGKRVVLYPFIMMDITNAQALPNPSGSGVQGAYPWRGRIEPRSGQSVASEISAFMGTAEASDFSVSGENVSYRGPNQWKFRRFILHLASLAKAAGGVDAFLIGTEMRGLSMAPHAPGNYPFVTALKSLAAEVRQILPSTDLSYAADWSEYHSHQDGGDLRFHLDPLWADSNIDFVGIDNYLPLSDWRPGAAHADFDNSKGYTSPYVLDYLKSNIEGGEYWDWFYASDEDRAAQIRTPIEDLAHGEPWVYRQKAIRDWRNNEHHERVGGTRQSSRTAWVPSSKPIWFTELGCPAVDAGTNQPNVFSAENTSESRFPYFSSGVRDDFIQRQFIRASFEWWAENGGADVSVNNIQVWCWDARPWPEFPRQVSTWADGPDWYLGHWLNGRAGTAPAAEAITRRLTERHGFSVTDIDVTRAYGQADGYPASAPLGFRDFLQPLEIGLGLQAYEKGGKLVIESRGAAITGPDVIEGVMVDVQTGAPFTAKRTAIEDVAATAIVRFVSGIDEYETVSTRAQIGAGQEEGASTAALPLVLDFDRGTAATERLLRSASDGREAITFKLPRSATEVRPGLILPVRIDGQAARPMIVERVVEGEDLAIEAKSFSAGSYASTGGVFRVGSGALVLGSATVLPIFLDLPLLPGSSADEWDSIIAFHADPWPTSVVWARPSDGTTGFFDVDIAPLRSVTGETITPLSPGSPTRWQWDRCDIRLNSGDLVTRSEIDVLSGLNALAVKHVAGWEVMQFRSAELIDLNTYRLTGLLRGRLGTDAAISEASLPAGADVVLLDETLTPLGLLENEVGLPGFYRVGPSEDDPSTHQIRPHTGLGIGRRPYSPAHLKGETNSGNLDLSWIRRTRIDGEADWRDEVGDVPLGEAFERYRVDVISSGEVIRSTEVSSPIYSYTAAQQAADAIATPIEVRVRQISETYGPGAPASLQIG
ncbi:MAG: glycoside hydrolase/phage tail family protein [Roseobacter sp.]